MKQTILPLALVSLYSLAKKFPGGREGGRSPGGAKRRRVLFFGLLGLALPLGVLAARNVSAGVPPLTFDTRQAIGLVWGNAYGADATTSAPPAMKRLLEEAGGSTTKTAWVVLEDYRRAPLALPMLFLKKLATFFNAYEVPDNANFYFFRDRLPLLRALPVFPCLLGVGLVGLFAALMRGVLQKDEFALAAVGILAPLAACLLVQTTSRYRVGAIGPLALGAGLFLLFTVDAARRRRLREASLLGSAAMALSLVPLFPSVIPAERHRWVDTVVYATLLEGVGDRDGAAQEVQRYLEEGTDDPRRNAGIASLRYWYETGDRSRTLVAPEGIAPPERRVKAPTK